MKCAPHNFLIFLVSCICLLPIPALAQQPELNMAGFFAPDTLPVRTTGVHTVTYFSGERGYFTKMNTPPLEKIYTLTYDKQGRKTQEILFPGKRGGRNLVTEYTYGANGEKTVYSYYTGTDDFETEEQREFIWRKEQRIPLPSGGYRFFAAKLRIGETYPDTTIWEYNANQHLVFSEQHEGGQMKTISFRKVDSAGRLLQSEMISGDLHVTEVYDRNGDVIELKTCHADTGCSSLKFTYDALRRRTEVLYTDEDSVVLRKKLVIKTGERIDEIQFVERKEYAEPFEVYEKKIFHYYASGKLKDDYHVEYGDTLEWNHYEYDASGTQQKYTVNYEHPGIIGYDANIDRTDHQYNKTFLTETRYTHFTLKTDSIKIYLAHPELFKPTRIKVRDTITGLLHYEAAHYYSKKEKSVKADSMFYDGQGRLVKQLIWYSSKHVDSVKATTVSTTKNIRYTDTGYEISIVSTKPVLNRHSRVIINGNKILLRDSVSDNSRYYDSLCYDSLGRLTYHYRGSFRNGIAREIAVAEYTYAWGEHVATYKHYAILPDGLRKYNEISNFIYKDHLPQRWEYTGPVIGNNPVRCRWEYTFY
jgi:hypothetical protein